MPTIASAELGAGNTELVRDSFFGFALIVLFLLRFRAPFGET
jgi:hypothetical protein